MSDTLYTPESPLRHPRRLFGDAAADLRRSFGVAWRLFRSNVQARHRRAWLGYLWLLIPTIGTTAVWWYVSSRGIIGVAAGDLPYPVHVFTGMTLWQVFTDALNAPLQQLTAGRQVITRSRVPHEALILAGVYEVLLNCAVRLLGVAVLFAIFAIPVTASIALVPIGILALLLLGLALGLFAAPFGMLYDDIGRAIALGSTFLFFLTPVIYRAPASGLLRLNPVTPLLDTTRAWLTSSGAMNGAFAIVTAAALIALCLAWILNRVARPHVVARLG